jgi:hypothetical protein
MVRCGSPVTVVRLCGVTIYDVLCTPSTQHPPITHLKISDSPGGVLKPAAPDSALRKLPMQHRVAEETSATIRAGLSC